MRNIGMLLSYDGSAYSGFQIQPNLRTIQGEIEQAIYRFTGERVKLISSGRTDAGVHARRQVINFTTASVIPVERWCLALNSMLPNDIVMLQAREMPMEFHARYSAKRKTYCYSINCSRFPDVFRRHVQFHHPRKLDVEAMRSALKWVEGEHDFTSFCSVKSTKESHVRTIYEARLEQRRDGCGPETGSIEIFLSGSGFLYNMVRIIVGTLLEIGEGKQESESMRRILLARNRKEAGPTAPPRGLMLWDLDYPDTDFAIDSWSNV